MAMADRIKECRIEAGLSQAELAERLCVSRQAVSKWESGKGAPDIANLQSMAKLFGVSVDYLLDDNSASSLGEPVLRQPIDVEAIEVTGKKTKRIGNRKVDIAVRRLYPSATIWPLIRWKKNTRFEEGLEWLTAFIFDGPFGIFRTADLFNNRDAYFLVEEEQRHLLVRVSKESAESREMSQKVTGATFQVGLDKFRKYRQPLAGGIAD
ncbi:MAG: helix-turn-helix transcriptional regulator [Actinomycetaceae bacterium]|nr:helix-turn-helix transcriptional regulator [Actinomycetaceae bacterium]